MAPGSCGGGGATGWVASGIAGLRSALAAYLVTHLRLSLAEPTRSLGMSTSGIAKTVEGAERREVH